jgi:predicted porin
MKKSLLAVAAMTAFAGAAQAQSSVTVYGILDYGFTGNNARVSGTGTTGNGVTARSGAGFAQGSETTTRLGFKGTEDLGGGMSAFFTVEMALNTDGTQAISNLTSSNRQTFIGLGKKGLGSISAGTQYTPVHLAVAATDPGQTNNVFGNVIYANTGGAARDNQTTSEANGSTFGYVVRTSNSIYLKADPIAGFVPSLFYTQNNANTNQTTTTTAPNTTVSGGTNNNTGYGIGLNYQGVNKLLVTANYQAFKSENPYVINNTTNVVTPTTAWGVAGANTSGANVNDTQMYFAATYDFGILKAYAQYLNRKVESTVDSNQYLKRSAQQIGVRSFITPKIEGWASMGNGRITAFGASQPTANFNAWQLGSNYWLSKRTNLYAIYGASNTSNVTVTNASGNPATTAANYGQYAIGMRHTF